MFDPITAAFIRSAPALPELNPADLPQRLTARYATLAARRLRGGGSSESANEEDDAEWPLARIAEAYEIIASVHKDQAIRRASAFVAGTAQQILAEEAVRAIDLLPPLLSRDRVDPALAAPLLFLAATQYADASEAAQRLRIRVQSEDPVVRALAEGVRDLAAGRLGGIIERSKSRLAEVSAQDDLESRGTTALFEALLVGVELLAAEALGKPATQNASARFNDAPSAFERVLELSTYMDESESSTVGRVLTTYPGPHHLASLLLAAYEATAGAAVTKIEPPPEADQGFWRAWLNYRAAGAPFVWPNHRDALEQGFHLPGRSAVIVLPTGAGKTTISCLKIAGVLALGKSVVFVAPTHALVDQLTVDLQEVFPEALLGSVVSSDFDRLFAAGTALRKIEVMTPERCLGLLSYAPHTFADVGLLVFDECHLLSPVSGLRRALDGMFCLLAFNSAVPNADLLFLSAMISNGRQFSEWIASVTGRDCIFIDSLWKPSRQARGVVLYEKTTIDSIQRAALLTQQQLNSSRGKPAKNLRQAAKAKLAAEPFALFGLQHNWLKETTAECSIANISGSAVGLNGELRYGKVALKPNVNGVASHIAVAAARSGLKAIVFVNVKSHAVSVARKIAAVLGQSPKPTRDEEFRWKALETELGALEHSLLDGPTVAVPHNAQMLPLERDLSERMFRRPDGAKVIVATPTLAQGLNLPAHIAILASEKRADPEGDGREDLAAHEILNAAARAGRAGHLANGLVLLIPEAVLTFGFKEPLDRTIVRKLQAVLPEDDRCLEMSDPLQVVLDRISAAATDDPDVEYVLNRLSTAVALEGAEAEAATPFRVDRSFAAFMAAGRNASEKFAAQLECLNNVLSQRTAGTELKALLELSAQSGAPVSALVALRRRLVASAGAIPATIPEWVSWACDWLSDDQDSRFSLLGREGRAILGAVGRQKDSALSPDVIQDLGQGLLAWLFGKPLCQIEVDLGGEPAAQRECPRARELVSSVIPLGVTYVMGLVARVAIEVPEIANGSVTPRSVVECLPMAVRRGFDTPIKLAYAEVRRGLLSRVQAHQAFAVLRQEPTVSSTDDYVTLVRMMRSYVD